MRLLGRGPQARIRARSRRIRTRRPELPVVERSTEGEDDSGEGHQRFRVHEGEQSTCARPARARFAREGDAVGPTIHDGRLESADIGSAPSSALLRAHDLVSSYAPRRAPPRERFGPTAQTFMSTRRNPKARRSVSGDGTKRPTSSIDDDPRVQRILATVDSIPKGRVSSYGDVAREAGLPRNARFVGRVLARLPAGSDLAWHRVVDASGRIRVGGASSIEQKRRLAREGVVVSAKNRVEQAFFVSSERRSAR